VAGGVAIGVIGAVAVLIAFVYFQYAEDKISKAFEDNKFLLVSQNYSQVANSAWFPTSLSLKVTSNAGSAS
jgi:uncharacterized membrane protein YukC